MRGRVHSTLPLISASQISTYRECKRKWAWRYIAGVKTDPHPSAVLGTEVHDEQLGPYLLEGREFDYTRPSGYIAAALREYLPKPKTPGMVVEKHFTLPSPASGGRFLYQGYIDLWLPDSALAGLPGGAPLVGDFKTSADIGKWAKTESSLHKDVQAQLYATYALYETGAEHVDLAWLYTQTKGARKAKRVHLRVHSDHVVSQFKEIENTAVELFDTLEAKVDPLSLPASPDQCEAYGGCPHRHRCYASLSPGASVAALAARDGFVEKEIGMDGTSSLLANLKAKKAGAAAGASAPTQAVDSSQEAAPSPSSPLGVNPPEKDLPPPPAVEPEVKKRGPGRPRKEKAAAGAQPDVAPAESPRPMEQLPLPLEEPQAASAALAAGDFPPSFTFRFFTADTEVTLHGCLRKDETVQQALARLGVTKPA